MQIGDLIFTTPSLRLLRENFPEAKIDLIIEKRNFLLVKNNPHLERVISFDKKQNFLEFCSFVKRLRETKYDLLINFQRSERASLIASLANAHRKVGLSKTLFKIFFQKIYDREKKPKIHQVDEYLKIAKLSKKEGAYFQESKEIKLEVQLNELTLSSFYLKDTEQKISNLLKRKKKSKIIGLNTGGSWETKQWGLLKFQELAQLLIQRDYYLIFFGASQEDQMRNQKIVKNLPSKRFFNLTGESNLLESAYFMRYCSILISGDSGPLHLALSQGIKVLGIFGPSSRECYFPYGQRKNVVFLENLLCSGCGLHRCKHHTCMNFISANEVLQRSLEILES